jgi:hypothetical protein
VGHELHFRRRDTMTTAQVQDPPQVAPISIPDSDTPTLAPKASDQDVATLTPKPSDQDAAALAPKASDQDVAALTPKTQAAKSDSATKPAKSAKPAKPAKPAAVEVIAHRKDPDRAVLKVKFSLFPGPFKAEVQRGRKRLGMSRLAMDDMVWTYYTSDRLAPTLAPGTVVVYGIPEGVDESTIRGAGQLQDVARYTGQIGAEDLLPHRADNHQRVPEGYEGPVDGPLYEAKDWQKVEWTLRKALGYQWARIRPGPRSPPGSGPPSGSFGMEVYYGRRGDDGYTSVEVIEGGGADASWNHAKARCKFDLLVDTKEESIAIGNTTTEESPGDVPDFSFPRAKPLSGAPVRGPGDRHRGRGLVGSRGCLRGVLIGLWGPESPGPHCHTPGGLRRRV